MVDATPSLTSLPTWMAMPSLEQYREQQICGLVRIGREWFVFWDGELLMHPYSTRLQAIDDLRRMDRKAKP